mgnify:CR=1 FL=1
MCTNQNVSSMKTTLLVVGRTVEQHFITAINDYVQRTKRYLSFEMEVIPELKNTKSLSMEVQKEKTLRDMESEIAGLAMSAATKVINDKSSGLDNAKLYDEFLGKAGDANDTDIH